eukprot:3940504-Rhodomonas_salina.3
MDWFACVATDRVDSVSPALSCLQLGDVSQVTCRRQLWRCDKIKRRIFSCQKKTVLTWACAGTRVLRGDLTAAAPVVLTSHILLSDAEIKSIALRHAYEKAAHSPGLVGSRWVHTLSQYRLNHGTIRYLSTAKHIVPYAISVPLKSWYHAISQYRETHSSIRYRSTAYRIAPYAIAVLLIA